MGQIITSLGQATLTSGAALYKNRVGPFLEKSRPLQRMRSITLYAFSYPITKLRIVLVLIGLS